MKKKMIVGTALLVTTLFGAGCSLLNNDNAKPSLVTTVMSTFKSGDSVLANWRQGEAWREALVSGTSGLNVQIVYKSDNMSGNLTLSNVTHVPPTQPTTIKVGDTVVAKWTDGLFYDGTVLEVTGTDVKIKWASGDSTVVESKYVYLPGV